MESAIGGSKVHIAKYSKPTSKALGESIRGGGLPRLNLVFLRLSFFLFFFWPPPASFVTPCRTLSMFVPEIDEAVVSDTLELNRAESIESTELEKL
jgi:hypothetical protein